MRYVATQLLFIPSCGLSLVPSFQRQEKEQESTRPGAEWPKALAELARGPGPTPADNRRVLSPGMGAHIPGRSLHQHPVHTTSLTSAIYPPCAPKQSRSILALLSRRNLPFFNQTVLLSPDFKARRKFSFRLNIFRSRLKSRRAWFLR